MKRNVCLRVSTFVSSPRVECAMFVVVVVVVVCLVLVTVAVQQEGSRDRCHWLSLRLLKNP